MMLIQNYEVLPLAQRCILQFQELISIPRSLLFHRTPRGPSAPGTMQRDLPEVQVEYSSVQPLDGEMFVPTLEQGSQRH